jgi:hypothetical protein
VTPPKRRAGSRPVRREVAEAIAGYAQRSREPTASVADRDRADMPADARLTRRYVRAARGVDGVGVPYVRYCLSSNAPISFRAP